MKNVSKSALIFPLLNAEEAKSILSSAGDLGRDSLSENFTPRTKSIGFMISSGGFWFQVHQNYFNQAGEYNQSGGGFRRYYEELPMKFLENKATIKLLDTFKKLCDIPDGELVLIQVQESHINTKSEGKCLTGQGIHSDGTNNAIVACLERRNIIGARTAVFEDPDGEQVVLGPTVLEEGEALFWDDNRTYHYVEPARLRDTSMCGSRTVLIGHYPAIYAINGLRNPQNSLPLSGKHPHFAKFEK